MDVLELTKAIQTLEIVRNAEEWEEHKLFNEGSLAATYAMRGMLYLQMNMFDEAITDCDKCIEIMEQLSCEQFEERKHGLAMAYVGKGIAYHFKGDFEGSIPNLNRGIEIWEELQKAGLFKEENINMLTLAYSISGATKNATSDNAYASAAQSDCEKSIDMESEHKSFDDDTLASMHFISGNSCDQMGEYEEANTHYDIAIEIWERLHKKDSEFAKAYMNRGANYYQTGKNDRALADYHKSIDIIEQLQSNGVEQDAFDMVMAYKNRGMAYEVAGNMKEAIDDNIKALHIMKKVLHEQSELQEEYDSTIEETIKMIEEEKNQALLSDFLQEFDV